MENRVTSTSKLEPAEQVIPPVYQLKPPPPTSEVSITPVRSPVIFRPPGLVDSEEEDEDIKPAMTYTPTTFPTSYPSMLRLLHPHLYRHYHPYLPYTNTMLGYHYQGHN